MGRPTTTLLLAGLLCLAAISSSTAQSPAPTPGAPVLGSGTDALAWLTSMGIDDPTTTPLADGQLRWEGTLPFSDVRVEFVGSPEALTSTSLTTSTGGDSYAGSLIVRWAQQFHPESLGFIVDALLRGAFVDELDAEAPMPGGTVRVSTVKDADAPVDEQTMTITISFTG